MTTEQFENKIMDSLRRTGVSREGKIGTALSGGADSVALTVALHRAGYEVTALHCDFSLRGEESDGDRRYCEYLTDRLGIDMRQVKFDTHGAKLPGESIEMACRRLRYDWFEEQAQELGLECIAVGHHTEDSVETMFLNLTRGSGPKGMSGIASRRGIYVRPMLSITRKDIENYLAEAGIEYRTDSSNLSNDYRRNALRNILLPKLYEIIPTAAAGIARTADAMRHSAAMIATYLKWCGERYCRDGKIDIERMRGDDIDVEGTLFMLIPEVTGCEAGMEVVDQILSEPENRASRLFPGGDGKQLELYHGMLERYYAGDDAEYEFCLEDGLHSPIGLYATIVDPAEFKRSAKGRDTIWLDGKVLDGRHQFKLRRKRDGDRMRPFGAPGERLVSDIFTDMKMSRSDKNRAYVLTIDDKPLWLVGIRGSNLYRVDENSKKIVKLQVR